MPFCFQCLRPKSEKNKCAFSGSLFFIFSTLEDGLRMIHMILGSGYYTHEGVRHEFSQVYEHRLGSQFFSPDARHEFSQVYEHRLGSQFFSPDAQCKSNRLAYILIDWEVEESRLGGRMTRSELQTLCLEFPLWFYKRMTELRLVDDDAFVTGKQSTTKNYFVTIFIILAQCANHSGLTRFPACLQLFSSRRAAC
jgi:hypothetical protein